jgi:hypothetical protein
VEHTMSSDFQGFADKTCRSSSCSPAMRRRLIVRDRIGPPIDVLVGIPDLIANDVRTISRGEIYERAGRAVRCGFVRP